MDEIKDNGNDSMSLIKSILAIAPLLVQIERQVVSILLVHGLVKIDQNIHGNMDDNKFSNISPTNKGQEILEDDPMFEDTFSQVIDQLKNTKPTSIGSLSEEDIESYRDIFPPGSKGSAKIVEYRLKKFMREYNCTLDEISAAAKLYIKNNQSKGYNIMGAHYFLYKMDPSSKVNESKCEEFLEEVRRLNIDNTPDWRDQVV